MCFGGAGGIGLAKALKCNIDHENTLSVDWNFQCVCVLKTLVEQRTADKPKLGVSILHNLSV